MCIRDRSYTFGEPERGDIAIFVYPDDAYKGITTYYVKRVIGMPGDTIDIIDGKIYINGSDTPLDEPYLHEEMEEEPPQHYEVPEGSYFMIGDNRNSVSYTHLSQRLKSPTTLTRIAQGAHTAKYTPAVPLTVIG